MNWRTCALVTGLTDPPPPQSFSLPGESCHQVGVFQTFCKVHHHGLQGQQYLHHVALQCTHEELSSVRWLSGGGAPSTHLHLIAMLPHHLHQPGDNVRHSVVVDWLFEGPEDLEGASSVVA